jgi:hypothetical protein
MHSENKHITKVGWKFGKVVYTVCPDTVTSNIFHK